MLAAVPFTFVIPNALQNLPPPHVSTVEHRQQPKQPLGDFPMRPTSSIVFPSSSMVLAVSEQVLPTTSVLVAREVCGQMS